MHLQKKKKKVLPRARARAKEEEGGSRRRMCEEEKNEGKEAFSSLCFGNGKDLVPHSVINHIGCRRKVSDTFFFRSGNH